MKRIINKLIMRALALLGFASTFVFMACYGPAPTNDYSDELAAEFIEEPQDSISSSTEALEP